MTFKCLNDSEEASIMGDRFEYGATVTELSGYYCVSPRTINRVLQKGGLFTPKQYQTAETVNVMATLKKHNITPADLDSLITKFVLMAKYRAVIEAIHFVNTVQAHNNQHAD